MIVLGSKKYTDKQAENIMANVLDKQNACRSKLEKVELRRNILGEFLEKNKGSEITLGEWLESKGVDCGKIFNSIGYFTPNNQAVSYDKENEFLNFWKGMVFNPEIKGYVPNREYVEKSHHLALTSSNLGMTYIPELGLYFPKTIYDTKLFSNAIGNGEDIIDLGGFFTSQDLSTFTALNHDTQEVIELLKELYEEEYDNVEEEYDTLLQIEDEYYSNFSNAESRPARNVSCRSACAVKHPFNKSKRESCQEECDKRFPPSEKQEARRDDRDTRRGARQDFRLSRKDCREQFRSGEITRQEMRECRREERQVRRQLVRDAGGNLFTRVGRGFARINPITASGRGASLIAISQLNLFGFATRLYPAFATGQELDRYKPESVQATKEAWIRISRAWRNLGGDPEKLRQAIINGRNKKIHKEPVSNAAEPVSTSAIVGLATAVIGAFTTILNAVLRRNNAPKDPFKSGQAPPEFTEALQRGELEYTPDPNDPIIDPETGDWIDPMTGKKIDPQTGRFEDEIFGMNKYLFYGLATAGIIGGIFLIKRLVKK